MHKTDTHSTSDGASTHFTRIAERVDTAPLLAELEAAPEMWLANTSRQRNVRCQRHTQSIFLRAARKPLPSGAKNANDVHESQVARGAKKFPRALAFCERVADELGATLGRATLVALLPKSQVFPHVDAGAYYRIRDRLHLVLKSSGGSPLTAGGKTVVMHEGELWAFDNKSRHSAHNPSLEPRVHLIFDLLPAPGRGFHVLPPDGTTPDRAAWEPPTGRRRPRSPATSSVRIDERRAPWVAGT